MSKKTVFGYMVLLILSVVVTYGVSIIDALIRNSFLAGQAGFPFRFSSTALLGSESTSYLMLTLDIVFWFVVILLIWKLVQKLIRRN